MFNQKTDYSKNKNTEDRIVYRNADGTEICLTAADFSSEEEFRRWKDWSDQDYHATEKNDHVYANHIVHLDISCCPVAESVSCQDVHAKHSNRQRDEYCESFLILIREQLTERQYRRMWLYYIEGQTIQSIAGLESVAHQNVSKSIRAARRKIIKCRLSLEGIVK